MVLASASLRADGSRGPGAADAEAQAEPAVVRLALSASAANRLHELRVKRLLEIELDDLSVAQQTTGPLDGDIIRVWIDAPSPNQIIIEVKRSDHPLVRRGLAVKKFSNDVTARIVAIAASDMVRAQARRPRRPAKPKPQPCPNENPLQPVRAQSGVNLTAAFGTLLLSNAAPTVLYGPQFALTHRTGRVGQTLYGSWLSGFDSRAALQWLEFGAQMDLRIALPASGWRLVVGAKGGPVAVAPTALGPATHDSSEYRWTAHVAAQAGVERQLGADSWLGLRLEPGGILGRVPYTDGSGENWRIRGFAMNASLGLTYDPLAE